MTSKKRNHQFTNLPILQFKDLKCCKLSFKAYRMKRQCWKGHYTPIYTPIKRGFQRLSGLYKAFSIRKLVYWWIFSSPQTSDLWKGLFMIVCWETTDPFPARKYGLNLTFYIFSVRLLFWCYHFWQHCKIDRSGQMDWTNYKTPKLKRIPVPLKLFIF